MKGRPPLGQHFLADNLVLGNFLSCVAPGKNDLFIEVGPGKGQLTLPLLEVGSKVIAIEKDKKLAGELPAILGTHASSCRIVEGDAAITLPVPAKRRWRLVGNIPYEISSPLLARLPLHSRRMVDAHLMVQSEFATRIAAMPGSRDYGRITVSVQAHFDVEILFGVKKESFSPPPKVSSSVVRLVPNKAADKIADPVLFEGLLLAAFAKRRKMLSNALAGLDGGLLEGHARKRAEELSVKDYISLANKLAKKK